jgi:tetratricopeptide (TPR) repeat protein
VDFKLKPISKSSIPEAVSKVELYRSLNEPEEAESICRDILAVDPHNQLAHRLLGLALTDQFTGGPADRYAEAAGIFESLTDPYERLYYSGLLHERRAKAQLRAGHLPHTLLVLFEKAMHCFEEAERIRPPDNDDALLRWNRCVRLLQSRLGSEWEKELEAFEASDSPPTSG